MTSCLFCQSDLEEQMTICPSCHAKKGYLKVNNLILGKSLLILFGLIVPFIVMLFSISSQTLFGVYVSIIMALPVLIAIWHLKAGVRWIQVMKSP